ncbi:hypothetical protein [Archaeoglobus veneficus]|uniref:Uncharacterized protein n=1 Tax=Archaeoglobus veneficus (strain DSM 11195 / SNP6) TaxID=693661 RepID=F2KPB6_ARCVS|nr:hypothetical protein [Archaeoglobus veneficus]AEA47520.1 hypothetical protein Arcve_1518 [Archaeoglobus veneficus SNP6]
MSQTQNNETIYEDFGKVKRTPLVKALEPLNPHQNICVKAPIREGKTFAVCYKISKTNPKVLFVVRTHEQAKEVMKRLTALGVSCAHVAGVMWKNFNYNYTGNAISWTPADLWKLLSKNRRKDIVKYTTQMIKDNMINAVVTVPEIAIWYDPKIFDLLVLDEEQTVRWFRLQSLLVFSYDRDFGKYTEDSPLERAYKMLESHKNKHIQAWCSWAKKVNEVIKSYRLYKEQYKAMNVDQPEKEALTRIKAELNVKYLPHKYFNNYHPDPEKIIRIIEYFKKKGKLNDDMYEAYNMLANTLATIFFEVLFVKSGARVWSKIDTDHVLFKDWLSCFKVIWLVLNRTSKADEWLFGKLNRNYKLISKDNFRFEPWFINVITSEPFEIAKFLYAHGVPSAWVTGRKKDARKLKDELRKHGVAGVIAEEHTKEEIEKLLLDGYQIILYLNSRVSKGIDLPMINVVFVYNYTFAVPDGDAMKAMRDELEQVILRCSPIDEDDPLPRLIVWCHKNERSKQEQEFVLNELRGNLDSNTKEIILKSNFLPLTNIRTMPTKITARKIKKKSPFFVSVENETETRSWSEIVQGLRNQDSECLITKNLEVLKLTKNASLLWLTLLKYTNDEKEKGEFFGIDSSALDQFWEKTKGKTLTPTDVDRWFRTVGIRRNVVKSLLLNLMVRAGLLRKEREGRKVKYEFVDVLPDPPETDETVEVKDIRIIEKHDPITGIVKMLAVSDAERRNDSNSGFIVDGFDLSPEG